MPQRIDFLDILCLNSPGNNLSGRYDVRDEAHQKSYGVKNPNGYPIDVRAYDNDYVYDNFTEGDPPLGWKDPEVVKWHVGNRMRGNRIMRRWINYPFPAPIVVTEDDSPFGMISHGVWDGVPHSVLGTKYVLHMPLNKDWGGDVKTIPTWLLQYFYNGKLVPGTLGMQYPSLETYDLGYDPELKRRMGLLQWTLFGMGADGKYAKKDQSTASNKLHPFKGRTEDGKRDQNERLVVHPFLGIDGVLPK